MKMNILMLVTTPFFLEKGSSLRVYNIVSALCQAGHKVDLITYPVGEDVKIKNLKIFRVKIKYKKTSPGPSLKKIWADKKIYDLAKKFLEKKDYDLIHGEDTEGGFLACKLGKKFDKKVVYDMHNIFSEQLKLHSWYFLLPIARLIERPLFKQPCLIITNWKNVEDKLKSMNANINSVLVYDALADSVKVPKIRLHKDYIVYSGNFEKYQGLELLLRAYKNANIGSKLLLIGEPSDDIVQLIKKLNLIKRVGLTGRLSIQETNYLIKNAKFCVIPRVHGDQPSMKIIHYFMNNKTILATDLKCNHEILKNNVNGLLVKPKVEAFSQGLKKMDEDESLIKKFENNIKKLVPTISQEEGRKRLISAYEKLKNGRA